MDMSNLTDSRGIMRIFENPFKNNSVSLSATDIFHLKRVQTQSNSDSLSIPVDLQAGLAFNGLRMTKLGQIIQ